MGLMSVGESSKVTKMITFTNLGGYPTGMFRLDYYEDYELVDSKTFDYSDSGMTWKFVRAVRTSNNCVLYSAATKVYNMSVLNVDNGYNGLRNKGDAILSIPWNHWTGKTTYEVHLVEE